MGGILFHFATMAPLNFSLFFLNVVVEQVFIEIV